MSLRRALVAAVVLFLVVVAIADIGWLPAAVLGVVVVVGGPYALRLLAQGQSEWFGREQRRKR